MTIGQDSDRYTLHFLGRPWHKTDIYIYIFCISQTIQKPDEAEDMTDYEN